MVHLSSRIANDLDVLGQKLVPELSMALAAWRAISLR